MTEGKLKFTLKSNPRLLIEKYEMAQLIVSVKWQKKNHHSGTDRWNENYPLVNIWHYYKEQKNTDWLVEALLVPDERTEYG